MNKTLSRIFKYSLWSLIAVVIVGMTSFSAEAQKHSSKRKSSSSRSSSQPTIVITEENTVKLEMILHPSGNMTVNRYYPQYNDVYDPGRGVISTRSYQSTPYETKSGSWTLDWMTTGSNGRRYYYEMRFGGDTYYMYKGDNVAYNNYHEFRNYGQSYKVKVTTR